MEFNQLIQLTEVFLVASSIFAVALADARNEKLKTGLSLAGIVVGAAWGVCAWCVTITRAPTAVMTILQVLPGLAIAGWVLSASIHGKNWLKGIEPERRV